MKEELGFESIKNKAIEQLKAAQSLLGKDGALVPLLGSILNAALEKLKIPDNYWLSGIFFDFHLSLVIRLGLEPKTPTLKVLCSTC